MKILFDHPMPFQLAHGGAQTQIEETMRALQNLGLTVEPLRWWDDSQEGDIVHFFNRPNSLYAKLVKARQRKLVISELLTGPGSWGFWRRLPNRFICLADSLLKGKLSARLHWDVYRCADAVIALTPWEAQIAAELYGAPTESISVVPNGVQMEFFGQAADSQSQEDKEDFIVCTTTITERKRVLELADAAVAAKIPILIVGKPYFESDPYFLRFLEIHRSHPQLVRYEGPVNDRQRLASIYRRARGFALLSAMESLSLSALEAVASGCPLLLSDLPWARCTFGDRIAYCPVTKKTSLTAASLKKFYDEAPSVERLPPPLTWMQVGQQIKAIYERILSRV